MYEHTNTARPPGVAHTLQISPILRIFSKRQNVRGKLETFFHDFLVLFL